jgi:nitrate reductase delta subunit
MTTTIHQPIFTLFGDLLDYPTPALAEQARECAARLLLDQSTPAHRLYEFMAFAEDTPPGQLEEIYTGTFDVNPACYIFAGYMLFGESFDRGKFLVRLQERYRQRGFVWGCELADHIPVILRFLGRLEPGDDLAQNLIDKCLLPVLQKMHSNFEADTNNPYAGLLLALIEVLQPLAHEPLDLSQLVVDGPAGMRDLEQPFLGDRVHGLAQPSLEMEFSM